MRKIFIYIILIFILISIISVNAQTQPVRAFIDTNNVLIGDQIKLSLTANIQGKGKVQFPAMPDSIGKIIFISRQKSDTVISGQIIKITQKYVITSFDSGEFVVPGFLILISNKNNTTDSFYTNDLYLKFRTVRVDTSQAFKDIKPIMGVPWNFWDYLPYLIVLLVAALIILAIFYFRKRFIKKETITVDYDPNIPPNLLALEALRQLEAEKLWQKGFIKQYHSQLSEILRIYIERQFYIIALEQTTIETIMELRNTDINSESIFTLKNILELADMVKFAKYQPIPDEHSSSLKNAFAFVEMTSLKFDNQNNSEETSNV